MKFSISGLLLATLLVSVSGAQTATHGAQTATQKSAAKAPAQASQARRSQPLAITGGARSTSPAEWLYAPHWNGGWFYGRYALPIASPFSPYNRALFPDLRLGDATLLIDGPPNGEVKLRGAPGTAQVFLDGAYEGIAGNLQTMSLAPGAHDLLISAPDRETFHRRIYVLSGKELKVTAVLKPKQ